MLVYYCHGGKEVDARDKNIKMLSFVKPQKLLYVRVSGRWRIDRRLGQNEKYQLHTLKIYYMEYINIRDCIIYIVRRGSFSPANGLI